MYAHILIPVGPFHLLPRRKRPPSRPSLDCKRFPGVWYSVLGHMRLRILRSTCPDTSCWSSLAPHGWRLPISEITSCRHTFGVQCPTLVFPWPRWWIWRRTRRWFPGEWRVLWSSTLRSSCDTRWQWHQRTIYCLAVTLSTGSRNQVRIHLDFRCGIHGANMSSTRIPMGQLLAHGRQGGSSRCDQGLGDFSVLVSHRLLYFNTLQIVSTDDERIQIDIYPVGELDR